MKRHAAAVAASAFGIVACTVLVASAARRPVDPAACDGAQPAGGRRCAWRSAYAEPTVLPATLRPRGKVVMPSDPPDVNVIGGQGVSKGGLAALRRGREVAAHPSGRRGVTQARVSVPKPRDVAVVREARRHARFRPVQVASAPFHDRAPDARPTREVPVVPVVPDGLPEGTSVGQQAWIGSDAADPKAVRLAVIVGPTSGSAVKGDMLHCWDQSVLYSGDNRWGRATVCDASHVDGDRPTWFVAYDQVTG